MVEVVKSLGRSVKQLRRTVMASAGSVPNWGADETVDEPNLAKWILRADCAADWVEKSTGGVRSIERTRLAWNFPCTPRRRAGARHGLPRSKREANSGGNLSIGAY